MLNGTLADYVMRMDGDLAVGTLLHRIAFRFSQGDVRQIIQTRQAWMAETGLTLKQYKRALSVLKKRSLVRVKTVRFENRTLTSLVVVPHPLSGGPLRDHVEASPITNTLSNVVKKKEVYFALGKGASRSTEEDGGKIEDSGGREKRTEEVSTVKTDGEQAVFSRGWLMKAKDVLKHHTGHTSTSLEAYWKSRCALVMNGYQKRLSSREAGQLKMLSKHLEDQTRPVIAYAIEHWVKFATLAGIAGGVTAPGEPHVGFLLKYHATAVKLLAAMELQEVSVVSPTEEIPVQSVAPVAAAEVPHVLTPQELAAFLEELEAPQKGTET